MPDPTIDQCLQMGLQHHQSGHIAEAEVLYGRVLEQQPEHAQALFLMGTIAGQRQQWERAEEFIRKAIALRPGEAGYHNNLGIALKRQGKLQEAVGAYRAALRCAETPEALSNLGNLLSATGNAPEAVRSCTRALELRPAYAEAAYNLGVALDATGEFAPARAAYERALALQPRLAEAHYRLGLGWKAEQQWARALESFRAALRLQPAMAEALLEAGVVQAAAGQPDLAIASYKQLLQLNPANGAALNNLANLLRDQGRAQDALAYYRHAVQVSPALPESWYNLAGALAAAGERAQALAAYQRAIALRPAYAEAHSNRGALLREMGQYGEAIASLEEALRHDPHSFAALNNLGVVLHALERFDEAIAAYRRALAGPGREADAEALNNLAAALSMTGRMDEAMDASQRAVRANPNHGGAHVNLGSGWKQQGELDKALAGYRRALEIKPDDVVAHSNLLYLLHFHEAYDAPMLLEEHRKWNRAHAAGLAKEIVPHGNQRAPGRRLRVGYVSADFRRHPIGRFMAGPLAAHDPAAVEVFCYSDAIVPDALTQRIRAGTHQWRTIAGMPDDQVAHLVRADQIDVLVDLAMHMNGNRMLMFARKPAPVQVTYLAYCSTTGLETMDYRITDGNIDPPGTDAFYTEKSWRLPGSYWCYEAPPDAPEVVEPPALRSDTVTFGCLNNFSKVSKRALVAWRELLHRMPRSRLILHAYAGTYLSRVAAFFAEGGIDAGRVEFVGLQRMGEYLETYQRIDIALDPFPYAGGTTTCDALWMGVPVVTLQGRTAVGRGGVSLLTNLGLEEMVGETVEQHLEIAAALGRDMSRLRILRGTMRERMMNSPIMDARQLARGLEAAYQKMWQRWCAANVP